MNGIARLLNSATSFWGREMKHTLTFATVLLFLFITVPKASATPSWKSADTIPIRLSSGTNLNVTIDLVEGDERQFANGDNCWPEYLTGDHHTKKNRYPKHIHIRIDLFPHAGTDEFGSPRTVVGAAGSSFNNIKCFWDWYYLSERSYSGTIAYGEYPDWNCHSYAFGWHTTWIQDVTFLYEDNTVATSDWSETRLLFNMDNVSNHVICVDSYTPGTVFDTITTSEKNREGTVYTASWTYFYPTLETDQRKLSAPSE